ATVYKTRASEFSDTKASALGDFVPAKLGFDEEENCKYMVETTDYSGYMIFVFENGKVAKVSLKAYETKTNRKKLSNAYGSKSKLIEAFYIKEDTNLMLKSTNERMIIFNTGMILPKASRDTIGVNALTLKSKNLLQKAFIISDEKAAELSKYRVKNIPAAGSFAKDLEAPDQLTF
ncbi:MAG: topoisomerase IV, partial [Ruminococcus sp.]|nr:topoisomerase IV [Ruminococcus sp.]